MKTAVLMTMLVLMIAVPGLAAAEEGEPESSTENCAQYPLEEELRCRLARIIWRVNVALA